MSLRLQPWCQGTKNAQERWCLGSAGGKKRSEQKTLINVSVLMKIQYLAQHMIRILASLLKGRNKQICVSPTCLPCSRVLQAVLLFYHEIPFWKQLKSISPLDDLLFLSREHQVALCRYSGWEENAARPVIVSYGQTPATQSYLLRRVVSRIWTSGLEHLCFLGILAQWVKAGCILTLAGEHSLHFHLALCRSRHIVTFKQYKTVLIQKSCHTE